MSKEEKEFTINYNGTSYEVTLRLDINALCDYCEEHDIDFTQWEKKMQDPRHIRSLAYHMARQGDNNLTVDLSQNLVGRLTFKQLQELMKYINDSAPDMDRMPSKKGNPKRGKST